MNDPFDTLARSIVPFKFKRLFIYTQTFCWCRSGYSNKHRQYGLVLERHSGEPSATTGRVRYQCETAAIMSYAQVRLEVFTIHEEIGLRDGFCLSRQESKSPAPEDRTASAVASPRTIKAARVCVLKI